MDLGIPSETLVEKLAQEIEKGDFFTVQPQATIHSFIEEIPGIRPMILAAAVRALGARKMYYDRKEGRMMFEPEFRTQLDACKFLAAYADGVPAQTVLNVNMERGKSPKDAEPASVEEALDNSPALREKLSQMIERSKRQSRGLKAPAVDV